MDDHILFIFLKFAAYLYFHIYVIIYIAICTDNIPRYLNLSTVSFVLPSTLISSLVLSLTFCWMTVILVLSWVILSSTFAAAFSKLLVIICKSSIKSVVNPIQDEEGWGWAEAPPTSFAPVTSTNIRISPQNFLTFSVNPFDRLV